VIGEAVASGAVLLAGYLLGSAPSGLLLVRWRASSDIRSRGSGNIGAANVLRETGWILGAATLLADAGKGALAAITARILAGSIGFLPEATALAAVLGHVYPPWLGFRGGKGVATACGAFGVLHPVPMMGAFLTFAAGLGVSRRASAGSVAGAAVYPVIAAWRGVAGVDLVLTVATALLILWTHRENMKRLVRGAEPRLQPLRGARGSPGKGER